jgi:hypothetical protein
MIYIAHRGNTKGINKNLENHPQYIHDAIKLGYDVEIDVRLVGNCWFLGHDSPDYEVGIDFLRNTKLWCHAKNIEAFDVMLQNGIHCFWHENDKYTLTSKGYIWAFPQSPLTERSICLLPEQTNQDYSNAFGVCSDIVEKLREKGSL